MYVGDEPFGAFYFSLVVCTTSEKEIESYEYFVVNVLGFLARSKI